MLPVSSKPFSLLRRKYLSQPYQPIVTTERKMGAAIFARFSNKHSQSAIFFTDTNAVDVEINHVKDKMESVFLSNSMTPPIKTSDPNAQHIAWKCRQMTFNGRKMANHSIWKGLRVEAPDGHTLFLTNRNHSSNILDIFVAPNFSSCNTPLR